MKQLNELCLRILQDDMQNYFECLEWYYPIIRYGKW
jgi:hypothetical protein